MAKKTITLDALSVPCPVKRCLRPVGVACVTYDSFRNPLMLKEPHPSRIRAALKAQTPKKPERVFKPATLGKRPANNFFIDCYTGVCSPDGGEFTQRRRRFVGGREILQGVNVKVYQRSAADKTGAKEVCWIEGRADASGKLKLRIFVPGKQGRPQEVILESTSYRMGSPVVAPIPLPGEEMNHGEDTDDETRNRGDADEGEPVGTRRPA